MLKEIFNFFGYTLTKKNTTGNTSEEFSVSDEDYTHTLLKIWTGNKRAGFNAPGLGSFNKENLVRHGSEFHGYYFTYGSSVEIGPTYFAVNGEKKKLSKKVQDEVLDFFESKGKGTIR